MAFCKLCGKYYTDGKVCKCQQETPDQFDLKLERSLCDDIPFDLTENTTATSVTIDIDIDKVQHTAEKVFDGDGKVTGTHKKYDRIVHKHFSIIYFATVCLLLCIVTAIYFYVSDIRRELLPPNANVGGIDIGLLTVEEANVRIFEAYSIYSVSVYDSFTQTELVFNENINLWFDYEAAVDAIFMQKSENWVTDLYTEYISSIEAILRFDSGLLIRFTEAFVSKWNTDTEQPEDAYIVLGENYFEVINEKEGKILDAQQVYNSLFSAVTGDMDTVDLSICRIPFNGTRADMLIDYLQHLNTYASFQLEYETGEVLDFRFLVENEWLLFGGAEVTLAEHKVIEYVVGLGDAYDSDRFVLDKGAESVQLISDIYDKAPVLRNMVFREVSDISEQINLSQTGNDGDHIGLMEFLNDLGLDWSGYLSIVDELEERTYPHYLSENAYRYANYWSLNPDMPASTVFALVNVNADHEAYSEISDVYEPDTIWLLVNKRFILSPNHEPDDLIRVGDTSYLLRHEAAQAFVNMRSDLRGQGLNLYPTSAYRSYSRQAEIYGDRVRSYGLEQADKEAARAGHSEHQTGLAIDFFNRPYSGRAQNARFQDTAAYGWLLQYAHYYGYILSYPEEYIHIHGNIFEPWHWRYVGVDIATAMYDRDIALYEEFYGKYLSPQVLNAVMQLVLEQREQGDVIDFERHLRTAA